jgi:predicted AAA+ superfamily ATPase
LALREWYIPSARCKSAVVNDFGPLKGRNDIGQLWEQYILSERIKFNSYSNYYPEYFFWRTYDGQEIDLLEVHNQKIQAMECKWKKQKSKVPAAFEKAYPHASYTQINSENYLDWIT